MTDAEQRAVEQIAAAAEALGRKIDTIPIVETAQAQRLAEAVWNLADSLRILRGEEEEC